MNQMFGFVRSFFSSAVAEPSASGKATVDKLIAESPVAVFSKSFCPFCSRAKNTLASQFEPAQIAIMELDQSADGNDVQAALAAKLGKSKVTVPQIFVGQEPIGGNSELNSLMSDNQEKWNSLVKSVSSTPKL